MSEKWTERDIPDQTVRIAVVTGANTGLGLETARALAARGARVVMAVRVEKGKAAAAKIVDAHPGAKVTLLELDLTSLASVRATADRLRADHERIDLLVNNAGPRGIGELVGHPVLVRSNTRSHDENLQRRLWKVSEELTGVSYPV